MITISQSFHAPLLAIMYLPPPVSSAGVPTMIRVPGMLNCFRAAATPTPDASVDVAIRFICGSVSQISYDTKLLLNLGSIKASNLRADFFVI